MGHRVFIGLGSNQGDRIAHCETAVRDIREIEATHLRSRSSWYATEPWGKEDQAWFVNGVIEIETDLGAPDLLARLQEIERRAGRKDGARWGPRPIDLDILCYDQLVIVSPILEIPHPRLHVRNFVLVPLAEIAPELLHPLRQETIRALLARSPDHRAVRKIES